MSRLDPVKKGQLAVALKHDGATAKQMRDELAAARERVVRDRKAHNPGPPLEPGPFAQVVDILERSPGRGIFGEAGSTLE